MASKRGRPVWRSHPHLEITYHGGQGSKRGTAKLTVPKELADRVKGREFTVEMVADGIFYRFAGEDPVTALAERVDRLEQLIVKQLTEEESP